MMTASLSKGPSRILTRLAKRHRDASLCTTEYALDEAERNVQHWRPDRLEAFRKTREGIQVYPEPSVELMNRVISTIPQKKRPRKKDWPILAGAVSANADWLVTRDAEDFGPLYDRRVCGVEILRPQAALDRLP